MPLTSRRPKAPRSRGSEPASEVAEPTAPAANLPKGRRFDLNPDDRIRAKADGRQPGAGQMVAALAHKWRVCRPGSLAMRHTAHGVNAVIGGVAGNSPLERGAGDAGRRRGSRAGKDCSPIGATKPLSFSQFLERNRFIDRMCVTLTE